MRFLLVYLCFLTGFTFSESASVAQFAPPAGKPGSTAVRSDSSVFIAWADSCQILRGYINITDTNQMYNGNNKATFGSYLYATGPADDLVVSLGDGGVATLGFSSPLVNRTGYDFAVFENAFNDSFLELGFVEVSSDGVRFVRFPAQSETQLTSQVNTFDTLDATRVHNLAGKYRHGYGTPFDLEDVKDSAGLDVSRVTHVRIIDVIGTLQPPFFSLDYKGRAINDPWPTPFDTGGFDLDAVGVINNAANGLGEMTGDGVRLFPQPCTDYVEVEVMRGSAARLTLVDSHGRVLGNLVVNGKVTVDTRSWPAGLYMARLILHDGRVVVRTMVRL